MRHIIVPDVHLRIDTVKMIQAREGDSAHYVYMGDWFDDFFDTPTAAAHTAKFLQSVVSTRPGDDVLLGNHESWYLWPACEGLLCSGNTYPKMLAIMEHLDIEAYIKRICLWTEIAGWVISHAGFNVALYESYFSKGHDNAKAHVLDRVGRGSCPDLLGAGQARGGWQKRGGLTWLDWNKEFEPIRGVHQLVGHTPASEPRCVDGMDSENHCIDTHSHHYAVIDDTQQAPGNLTIERLF